MDRYRCPILQRPFRGAARLNRYRLRSLLACCLALLGAGYAAHARAARTPPTVVVQDAYVDLRTGPGRGFPATRSIERSASIQLLVGVHAQNPRGLCGLQGHVTGLGEIVLPGRVEHPCSQRRRQRWCAVNTARVDDDHLLRDPCQGSHESVQVVRFVACDEAHAQGQRGHGMYPLQWSGGVRRSSADISL
jgi:hypothetical protein